MGRAFPEANVHVFYLWPTGGAAALCDIRHNVVLFDEVRDAFWLERMARAVTIQMGCHAAMLWPPGAVLRLRALAVLHTVTQACTIGTVVLDARRRQENPIPALVASQGMHLFQGKIVDVLRRVTGGLRVGGDHRGAR
jgi:DUF917 family protein